MDAISGRGTGDISRDHPEDRPSQPTTRVVGLLLLLHGVEQVPPDDTEQQRTAAAVLLQLLSDEETAQEQRVDNERGQRGNEQVRV